jgi:Spermidine/putrescine-binding periplasmic protein
MAGCLGGGSGTLTVSTWSGTNVEVFRETIKPMYEDQTGNDVKIVGNWENILGKVRQSPSDDPPFDLTVGSNRDHYLGDQDDLWEPIRYDNIPNADTVKPTLNNNLESDRGIPVAYGVMGYAYNADEVDFQLSSWRDLVTQDVNMDLALPGSYFFNTVIMGAIATDEAPMEEELYSDSQRDLIFETLREMPISKFYEGAQDLWTSMSQGVADVGQYFYAYSRKRDQTGDMNIGIQVPDRTMGYVDHYQVARGSSNRQSAEEFINFLLQEDVQTAYAEAFNLGMASKEATHPEATRAEVPIENAELEGNTVFKQYSQVAESASNLNDRFTEFQTEF